MSHPRSPLGARSREIQILHQLHHLAESSADPAVSGVMREAERLIVNLIGERGQNREMYRQIDEAGEG